MSSGSLTVLARLSGAARVPPRALFTDSWPGRLRRAAQLLFSALQWVTNRQPGLVIYGPGVPAAAGEAQILSSLGVREWFRGAYVMHGARLAKLVEHLRLDPDSITSLYLADSDVLIVFGRRDGEPVVVHISDDLVRLQRYGQNAGIARRLLEAQGLGAIVPRVIEQSHVLDYAMLVQERLAGRVIAARSLSAGDLAHCVRSALQPLRALASTSVSTSKGADDVLINVTLSGLASHPELGPSVCFPLVALRNWEGRRTLPAVYAHGDYWLSNILFHESSDFAVNAVLDWERARLEALAGFDGLYLAVLAFAHWRGCSEMHVLCQLWEADCEPLLKGLVAIVAEELSLSFQDLRHVALAIWLRHLHQHAPEIAEWSPQRRREWLDEPARCAGQWLRTFGVVLGPRDRASSPDRGAI